MSNLASYDLIVNNQSLFKHKTSEPWLVVRKMWKLLFALNGVSGLFHGNCFQVSVFKCETSE